MRKKLFLLTIVCLLVFKTGYSQIPYFTSNSVYVGSPSFTDRSGSGDNLYIRQPNQTTGSWWGARVEILNKSAHTADFSPFQYYSTADSKFYFNVDKEGGAYFAGNVGIGTTSPEGKTHIVGANSSFPATSGTSQTGLSLRLQNSNSNLVLDIGGNGSYGAWLQATHRTAGFSNNYSLLLNPNGGNVLIGKTSQTNNTYKLDVEGKIRANEVVVNTSGADFVFEKGYKLPTLGEVEQHIKENGHLPGVAPATEMQQNGVNVSEMQTKLLQKVEELTLYMIEQNKKIDAQNEEIKQLKKQIYKTK